MQTMTRRTWTVLAATVVATSALTAAATTAIANHQFSDVATSSFFHEEIAAIFDAGCASGFKDGTFGPADPTTRGQFTFWLNNCGGRVAFASDGARPLSTGTETSLGQADMTAGALPTGGGFVVALASVQASTTGCGAGCVVEFRLRRDGVNGPILETLPIRLGEEGQTGASVQTVFPVNGGSDTTVALSAVRTSGTDTVVVDGSVTLLYVPFAGDGTGGGQESAGG
jgi:hypothetical protein